MAKQPKLKEGVKFDQHKIRWDLVPYDAVNEIAKILTFGAIKYEARNWERGMKWSRAFGALQRHMTRWFQGQDKDKETKLSHLANAGCCLFFLLSWELRNVGEDDRPKLSPELLEHMDNMDFMESALAMMQEITKQSKPKKVNKKKSTKKRIRR